MSMLVSSALPAVTATAFNPPSIDEFFPDAFWLAGTPLAINRVIFVRLIITAVLALMLVLSARAPKLVPGRWQSCMEMLFGFVRTNIAEEMLGGKARKYVPLITVIFLGVFFMNATGVIPGLQIAATSIIGMPMIYAVVAYVAFIVAGIKEQGAGHYFKTSLMPAGVPKPLYLLLTPIEFFSTFIIRPFTLTVRLLANMISGHLLLALCFVATSFFFFEASAALKGLGALTLLMGFAFTLFELFVAALQAYIFALLTAVYINLSISEH